jgi:uncharacterized membrane protein
MDRKLLMCTHRYCAVLALLLMTCTATADDSVSPLDADGHLVDFQRDIAPILVQRCLDCHGPEDAKNDFRVDDVDTLMDYVEPEDVESSSLFTDYLITDSEDELMPPAEQGGPLSAGELALIRIWIEEGANWPEGAVVAAAASGEAVPEPKPVDAPRSLAERLWAFQGFLHPATVHFPIALLLFGALFVVLGWKWPKLGTQIPLACLLIGAPSAIGATLMGWSFADEQGYAGWRTIDMDSELFWHRWSGVIVTVVSTVLAIVALLAIRRGNEKLTRVWKVGLLAVAAMVGAVGHQGGELSYGSDFYPKAFRILLGTTDEVAEEVVAEPEADPATTANHDSPAPALNDLSGD